MKQDTFLFEGTTNSQYSAERSIREILPYFEGLHSFLDLGCGMGAWSKAFEDLGYNKFDLVDHPSTPVNKLLVAGKEHFLGVDLENELPPDRIYDFAICIEVLEHFRQARALKILDYLCSSTSMIIFSAAIPRQWGLGHYNLQRHAYWHNEFSKRGFNYFDGFKPNLIGDIKINYWIRQNIFLYYKVEHEHRFSGIQNITNLEFEIVHTSVLNKPFGKKEIINLLWNSFFKG